MATIFSLVEDYGWVNIDPDTGEIDASSTDLIEGRFPITIIQDTDGTITNHDIDIEVYNPNPVGGRPTTTMGDIKVSEPIKFSSVQWFGNVPSTIGSPDYHTIVVRRQNYTSNEMDVVICDESDGSVIVLQDDGNPLQFNGARHIRSDEGQLVFFLEDYVNNSKGVASYDPATKTIIRDEAIIPAGVYTSEQAYSCLNPYDRRVYVYGNNGAQSSLGSFNTATKIYTHHGVIDTYVNALSTEIAVDEFHAYTVNDYGELYRCDLDASNVETVALTAEGGIGITLVQGRGGVIAEFRDVIGFTDGEYWVYNSNITPIISYSNPPWTPIDGGAEDLGPEIFQGQGSSSFSIGEVQYDGSGRISTTQSGGDKFVFNYVCRVYNSPLDRVLILDDGRTFVSGGFYSGQRVLETLTYTGAGWGLGSSRPCIVQHSNGRIYSSGYASQVVYEMDVTDNDNVSPAFMGYLGGSSPSGGHYINTLVEASDSYVYGFGSQFRVDDSGTAAWFHPDDFDGTVGGFSDIVNPALEDYAFNKGAYLSLINKIALPAYITIGSSETQAQLWVFDVATRTFDTPINVGTVLKTLGHLCAVSDTEIVGASMNDANTNLYLYKIDIVTRQVLWEVEVPYLQNQINVNVHTSIESPIEFGADGYVYLTGAFEGTFYMLRVNVEIGGVEILGTQFTNNYEQFALDANLKMYKTTLAGDLTLIDNIGRGVFENMPMSVLDVGPELLINPDFDATNGWYLGNDSDWVLGTGQAVFTDTGKSGTFMIQSTGLSEGDRGRVDIVISSLVGQSTLFVKVCGRGYYLEQGTYSLDFTMSGTNSDATVTVTSATSISIDRFSVKQLVDTLA